MLNLSPKWIALVALVVQNSGLAIMMRYTLTFSPSTDKYSPSTAVLLAEILKFLISILFCFYFDAQGSFGALKLILKTELSESKSDWLKLMIPSLLYTLQNSLQYFSMSVLSAPVFQVLYQMKIITTAIFSVTLLSKQISASQWMSVIALAGGVALVQLSQLHDNGGSTSSTNSLAGLISVLCGCLTSGFAGVYFEKTLKSSKTSIWIRNIQLSLIGTIFSAAAVYSRDREVVSTQGLLHGYNAHVWMVIALQAVGGMIVAIVVKYADNVLKGFATSLSILLSCVASSLLFNDVDFSPAFLFGSMIVLFSVFGYGYNPGPGTSALELLGMKSLAGLGSGGGNGGPDSPTGGKILSA